MEVSVFASSLMQHLIHVCVERLPNWEVTQSFRPPPTQANTLCVCLRVESGHRWSAVASKWCQPLQCRSQKLNFNQKAKKKKRKEEKWSGKSCKPTETQRKRPHVVCVKVELCECVWPAWLMRRCWTLAWHDPTHTHTHARSITQILAKRVYSH